MKYSAPLSRLVINVTERTEKKLRQHAMKNKVVRITSVPEKYTIIYKTTNSYNFNALQMLRSTES